MAQIVKLTDESIGREVGITVVGMHDTVRV